MSLTAESVTLILGDGDRQLTVLDNVDLAIRTGEMVAVVGPSGAGKSSLLAVCGGLRTPTSGKILIDGTDISKLSRSALSETRRKDIGFVFQQSNLVPSLTAVNQLMLTVYLDGRRPNSEDRNRAHELLDEMGVDHCKTRRPEHLSGGERQRVGIARALMTRPKVLLVDEPTSMLDHNRGQKTVELLVKACHDHGIATAMVTHDTSVLESADRIVYISDGKLSARTSGTSQTDLK